MKMYKRTST